MDDPDDVHGRIGLLERDLREARIALSRHVGVETETPDPRRVEARIRVLEAELAGSAARTAALSRTIDRARSNRDKRLVDEIARLEAAIETARPLATGDLALFERLQAARASLARQTRAIEVTRAAMLDADGGPSTSAHPSVWISRPSSRSGLKLLLGIGVCVLPVCLWLGAAALVSWACIVAVAALQLVVFPGARDRELVSPRALYGSPWTDVTRVAVISDSRLDVEVGGRVHSFDQQMPAFREVRLLALEAAARHEIPVRRSGRALISPGIAAPPDADADA